MTSDGVLVRFGEIGIKSAPVRRGMVERLRQNLLDGLLRDGVEGDVKAVGSRLWMVGSDPEALLDVACRTFGVVSASPCTLVPSTMESLCATAAQLALGQSWSTFAIRATREGQHPFSSQDIQVKAGSAVWTAAKAAGRTPKVDLSKPDLEVHIDVRQDKAYLFTTTRDGPGGIPVGTQGTVVLLLNDEASFLAGWLLMRRGCRLVPVHAGTTGSLDMDAVARLVRWGMPPDVVLLPVCSGTVSKAALLAAATRIAKEARAAALATGDTLDSALVPAELPVLRPLAGLLPAERDRWLARAGLGAVACESILDPASSETVDGLLAMRRTVAPGRAPPRRACASSSRVPAPSANGSDCASCRPARTSRSWPVRPTSRRLRVTACASRASPRRTATCPPCPRWPTCAAPSTSSC
jgi:adenylyl- and sulfurtransferase ThiI